MIKNLHDFQSNLKIAHAIVIFGVQGLIIRANGIA